MPPKRKGLCSLFLQFSHGSEASMPKKWRHSTKPGPYLLHFIFPCVIKVYQWSNLLFSYQGIHVGSSLRLLKIRNVPCAKGQWAVIRLHTMKCQSSISVKPDCSFPHQHAMLSILVPFRCTVFGFYYAVILIWSHISLRGISLEVRR